MRAQETRSGGGGLERSCGRGWIAGDGPVGGVERFRAWFPGEAYARHRHDTYAVGVTDCGVQVFDYRGAVRTSTPGEVVVLHPDEVHDGRAGTGDVFGYRIVYVEPARLAEALRELRGRPGPLPFVREAVSADGRLSRAVAGAFRGPLEPLAADALVLELAGALLAATAEREPPGLARRVDAAAVERARQFLDVECTRVVRSTELERITGLTRYELPASSGRCSARAPTGTWSCAASISPGRGSTSSARWSRRPATPGSPTRRTSPARSGRRSGSRRPAIARCGPRDAT
jgi:hypothetical protein